MLSFGVLRSWVISSNEEKCSPLDDSSHQHSEEVGQRKAFQAGPRSGGTPHYLLIAGMGHVCSSMTMRHRATSDQDDLSAAEEVTREEKADLLAPAAGI